MEKVPFSCFFLPSCGFLASRVDPCSALHALPQSSRVSGAGRFLSDVKYSGNAFPDKLPRSGKRFREQIINSGKEPKAEKPYGRIYL